MQEMTQAAEAMPAEPKDCSGDYGRPETYEASGPPTTMNQGPQPAGASPGGQGEPGPAAKDSGSCQTAPQAGGHGDQGGSEHSCSCGAAEAGPQAAPSYQQPPSGSYPGNFPGQAPSGPSGPAYQASGGYAPHGVYTAPHGQYFTPPHPGMSGPGTHPGGYHQPQMQPQAPGPYPHYCGHPPASGPGHPKHEAHQYGQFMQLVTDVANGSADPARVMDFLGALDARFWKGALVGVGATLLLTNDTAKNAIVGALSGLMGKPGQDKPEEKTA